MQNKKAQQAVGMSFNTIFSLILIIAFVAFAFVAVKFFLNLQQTTQVGQFYQNFQTEIDNARSSTTTEIEYSIKLPNKITHVCFANMSKEKNADKEIVSQIISYDYESNVFLIPQNAVTTKSMSFIEGLDIETITKNQNPYCVEAKDGIITIIKNAYSKLVSVY